MSEQLSQEKGIGPALETRKSHTTEHGVTKIVPQNTDKGIKSGDTARFCREEAHRCTDVRSQHRV